ncbi:protein DMP7-like [Magnolia sinica]|uniref:protein DMP7-like n=1 Tax=Magnolia sinica TaxID=86752 RepID=UPI002658316D|nr:protein DMP7-like [Magnolia sinica]
MEIKPADVESQHRQPLLDEHDPTPAPPALPDQNQKTQKRKVINRTFKSTARLANLLPTGTVLAFQVLSPIFTNQGHCTGLGWHLTVALVSMCAASCFLLSFTDSFRDTAGKVRYGLATRKGLWVIDVKGSVALSAEDATKYRLKFIDFVHAFMSVFVFAAVGLIDKNMVGCFYPTPSEHTKNLLAALPVGFCIVCSILFICFPTKRHGIGFPLSSR